MVERDTSQPGAQIGDGRHGARDAAPIDQGRSRSVERERPIFGNREIEGRLPRRQGDLPAEDGLAAFEHPVHVVDTRDPAPQAPPGIPLPPDLRLIVQTEPARDFGRTGLGIERDDLQIDGTAELEQVIMGAHAEMALAEGDIEIEARPNVPDPLVQIGSDDGEMIQNEHARQGSMAGGPLSTVAKPADNRPIGAADPESLSLDTTRRIVISSDHAAIALRRALASHIATCGWEVVDIGPTSPESTHYPKHGEAAARLVASGACRLGLVLCGTGQGIMMAANKVRGIRCGVCSEPFSARMIRQHNDANMLSIGARIVGEGLAIEIVEAFLNAEFEGGRHATRVAMIDGLEA